MIDTIIIEDEPAVRREIEWLIKQEPDFTLVGTATSVSSALKLIQAAKPKLVLMDIQLTDGVAFDILDQLEEVNFRVIFITAYNHFAIKAIKYGALDYLLKPLDDAELKTVLKKIVTENNASFEQKQQLAIAKSQGNTESNLETRIVLHTQEFLQVLQLKEILYCQSDGSYTTFYRTDGQKLMVSKPLKYFDELLPDLFFLRPHQSYLVNISYVDKFLKSGLLILKDGTEIPVSGRRKEYIIQRISHI